MGSRLGRKNKNPKGRFLPCENCAKVVYRPKSHIFPGKRVYCNKNCVRIGLKGKPNFKNRGSNNAQWKGGKQWYSNIHDWVSRVLGKPDKCGFCGKTDKKKYEWANISKEYERDLKDWVRLCTSCHRNYDMTNDRMLNQIQQDPILQAEFNNYLEYIKKTIPKDE